MNADLVDQGIKEAWSRVYCLENNGIFSISGISGALNPESGCSGPVLDFIKTFEKDEHGGCTSFGTGRLKNTLQVFCLPGDGRSVVLKKTSANASGLPWSRKLEVWFKAVHRNYARTAFMGSLALYCAGIPTPRPLAWWTSRTGLAKESYYLYEKLSAEGTLSEKLQRIWMERGHAGTDEASELIALMACLTRKMHKARIRHGDIVSHNFLVCKHQSQLALIDTDHVQPAKYWWPEIVQKFIGLHCLRRLDFSAEGQRFFLAKYLGREVTLQDWLAFRFWYLGGFSFSRWFKRLRKWLRGASRKQPKGVAWWFPY